MNLIPADALCLEAGVKEKTQRSFSKTTLNYLAV